LGTIVVVDDDHLVLYGVVSYLRSKASPHTVTGSFTDPAKAVSFIIDHPCDLLITDIKMPKLSGFDVIEQVKAVHPGIRVIVLSGHADFALARNAITLKVDAYLLKHEIDEQSLLRTVGLLIPDRPQQERLSDGGLKTINQLFSQSGPLQSPPLSREKTYLVAVYTYKHRWDDSGKESSSAPNLIMLYQMIEDKLAQQGGGECFFGNYQDIVIILTSPDENPVERQAKLLLHLQDILKTTSRYLNFKVFIAVAGRLFSRDELDAAYAEARDNAMDSFFLTESSFISPERAYAEDFDIPELSLHESFLHDGFKDQIRDFFALPFRETRDGVKRMKLHITVALDGLNSWLLRSYSLSFESILGETAGMLYERIYQIDDEAVLKSMMMKLCETISKAIAGHKHSRSIVGSVQDYVERNYNKPLTLNEIADIFNINMSYLSTLFKQETGINFIEYVHQVRLTQACRLFTDTSLSLKEIAFAVGYQDANHFSKVFSRVMGETATEYRERLLKERSGGR
jgi:two-component system response regulator YesN